MRAQLLPFSTETLMNAITPLRRETSPDDLLPPMTYRDFLAALERVASGRRHQKMAPFLVSALQQQAPFLTGEMLMFEILCSGSCMADQPTPAFDA